MFREFNNKGSFFASLSLVMLVLNSLDVASKDSGTYQNRIVTLISEIAKTSFGSFLVS